jgi:hypothetical protein
MDNKLGTVSVFWQDSHTVVSKCSIYFLLTLMSKCIRNSQFRGGHLSVLWKEGSAQ